MRLLIILIDDAIKYMYIWPLTWCCTVHQHLFSDFSPFHSPVKEKGKQWRMKGFTMVQWINLNQNVSAHPYSVLCEKTGPIILLLVCIRRSRQTGRQAGQLYFPLVVKVSHSTKYWYAKTDLLLQLRFIHCTMWVFSSFIATLSIGAGIGGAVGAFHTKNSEPPHFTK